MCCYLWTSGVHIKTGGNDSSLSYALLYFLSLFSAHSPHTRSDELRHSISCGSLMNAALQTDCICGIIVRFLRLCASDVHVGSSHLCSCIPHSYPNCISIVSSCLTSWIRVGIVSVLLRMLIRSSQSVRDFSLVRNVFFHVFLFRARFSMLVQSIPASKSIRRQYEIVPPRRHPLVVVVCAQFPNTALFTARQFGIRRMCPIR